MKWLVPTLSKSSQQLATQFMSCSWFLL